MDWHEGMIQYTFCAVGCIHPSLTVLAPFPTVVVNHPNPFVNAATGSFWNSSTPGNAPPFCAPPPVGGGSLPNPAYFPPCEGGKSAGLDEFSLPFFAKNDSFASFLERPPRDAVGDAVLAGVLLPNPFDPVAVLSTFFFPGIPVNSLPSTLALSISFHSSPVSPEYLSSNPISAQLLPSFSSQKVFHASLPPSSILIISFPLNASIVILRTKEMCTPNPRCRPAHVRHMNVPNLGEAHCGDGAPQSQQLALPGRFWIARSYHDING